MNDELKSFIYSAQKRWERFLKSLPAGKAALLHELNHMPIAIGVKVANEDELFATQRQYFELGDQVRKIDLQYALEKGML